MKNNRAERRLNSSQEGTLWTLAIMVVMSVANATTLTELRGMRMAEISGVRNPAAAKEMPKALYRKEMAKLAVTMRMLVPEKRMKSGNFLNLPASRMASQAGEK